MKILVMGAGAIGAFYGAKLKQAGEDVFLCARGEHLRALKAQGLTIITPRADFRRAAPQALPESRSDAEGAGQSKDSVIEIPATESPAEFAPYELVLFCVKSYDTIAAANQLKGCLSAGGVVMTLQNGVENEAALCTVFPRESVMGGNARVGAEIVAPGVLLHTGYGYIEFGELDGSESPRARRFAEMFRRAGIFGELTRDLKTTRWVKLMGNNSTNCVCAVGKCSLNEAMNDLDAYRLMRELMFETVRAGKAEGAIMTDETAEKALHRLRAIAAKDEIRPSTLQDVERGKRLEYEAITGAVIHAAERHGIEVPVTRAMHALLKLLDKSRS